MARRKAAGPKRRTLTVDDLTMPDLMTLVLGNWEPGRRDSRWFTLDEMRADWRLIRDEFMGRRPFGRARYWSALVFDEGMTPDEAWRQVHDELDGDES